MTDDTKTKLKVLYSVCALPPENMWSKRKESDLFDYSSNPFQSALWKPWGSIERVDILILWSRLNHQNANHVFNEDILSLWNLFRT